MIRSLIHFGGPHGRKLLSLRVLPIQPASSFVKTYHNLPSAEKPIIKKISSMNPKDVTLDARYDEAKLLLVQEEVGDRIQALEILKSTSQSGHLPSMNILGKLYIEGNVQTDVKTGLKLLETASRHGFLPSMNTLGRYLLQGVVVSQDIQKGWLLIKEAAARGDTTARAFMGNCLAYGNYINQDIEKALKIYFELHEEGNSEGTIELGHLFAIGKGVPKDLPKAVEYWENAASKGSMQAVYKLGLCYTTEEFGLKDTRKALECFTKAAEAGHAGAKYRLAVGYHDGGFGEVNVQKAVNLYRELAVVNHADGMFGFGQMHFYGAGDLRENRRFGMQLMKQAGELGSEEACFKLAVMSFEGEYVEKDYAQAYNQFEMLAIRRNHPGACFYVGLMNRKGYHVPQNYEKAFSSLFRAKDRFPASNLQIAVMFLNGEGRETDRKEAFKYISKAVKDDPDATFNLASQLLCGSGGEAENGGFAYDILSLLAANSHSNAILTLGTMYKNGVVVQKNEVKAFEMFSLLAKKNNEYALFNVGKMLDEGVAVERNVKESRLLLKLASDAGVYQAESYLETMKV